MSQEFSKPTLECASHFKSQLIKLRPFFKLIWACDCHLVINVFIGFQNFIKQNIFYISIEHACVTDITKSSPPHNKKCLHFARIVGSETGLGMQPCYQLMWPNKI